MRPLVDEAAVSAVRGGGIATLDRNVNVAGMAADFAGLSTMIASFTQWQADSPRCFGRGPAPPGLSLADWARLALAAVKGRLSGRRMEP